MANAALPTTAETNPALPTFPYDRVRMVHQLQRGITRDGQPRFIERPVARSYEEAQKNDYDYWHPGGELRLDDGRVVGRRPAGWYLFGYKWQDDRPENYGDNLPLDELFGTTR